MTPLSVWEKNLIEAENGKFFINSRIFDGISGKERPNKFRRFETIVAEMFKGQNQDPNEFVRKIPVKGQKWTPIFLAANVARLLVLRGFTDLPWKSCREQFVEFFFNKDVIPYVNPYMTNVNAKDVNPEIVNPTENISLRTKSTPLKISSSRKMSTPRKKSAFQNHSNNERVTFRTPPNIHFSESKLVTTETKKLNETIFSTQL